jgi:hypothetical protein
MKQRERERGRESGRSNWRRQVGSIGQRAREGGRARGELPLIGGAACQAARARGLAGLSGPAGLLSPFLFL